MQVAAQLLRAVEATEPRLVEPLASAASLFAAGAAEQQLGVAELPVPRALLGAETVSEYAVQVPETQGRPDRVETAAPD